MKKAIFNVLLRMVSLISAVLFCFSSLKKTNSEKIRALSNKHVGKRCFIIGNGPSLDSADLDKIHAAGDLSFAANKIANIFDRTKWRPTYYCVFDEGMPKDIVELMSQTTADKKFFRKSSYYWTRKVKGDCVFLHTKGGMEYLDNPVFSDDVPEVLYTVATVTYAALQLAVFMGINEIYLLGVDNNYAIDKKKDGSLVKDASAKSYFEGAPEKDNKKCVGSQWEMNIVYEAAKSYADAHNIRIYNATRGGKLEIFPRVNFDLLF